METGNEALTMETKWKRTGNERPFLETDWKRSLKPRHAMETRIEIFVSIIAALLAAQNEAKEARRGLWADASPVPPWEWRSNSNRSS